MLLAEGIDAFILFILFQHFLLKIKKIIVIFIKVYLEGRALVRRFIRRYYYGEL